MGGTIQSNLVNAGMATLTGSETLTNKTLTAPVITAPVITGNITGAHSLLGTITNDDAAAGYVGEYMEQTVSTATSIVTNNTFIDVASLSLTAGDWDVTGIVRFILNGATCAFVRATVNSGSGNVGGTPGVNSFDNAPPTATNVSTVPVPNVRFSLSATTTVYLKACASFSAGNPQYQCRISARRVR